MLFVRRAFLPVSPWIGQECLIIRTAGYPNGWSTIGSIFFGTVLATPPQTAPVVAQSR